MFVGFPAQSFDLGTPAPTRGDIQIFVGSQDGYNWQAWNKPPRVTMVYIVCIGGGGGGGGGFTMTGNQGGGGGSGACSGITRLLVPAFLLPDILSVQVGQGGLGGAPGTAGASGSNSFVCYGNTAAAPNIIIQSNTNTPVGVALA